MPEVLTSAVHFSDANNVRPVLEGFGKERIGDAE